MKMTPPGRTPLRLLVPAIFLQACLEARPEIIAEQRTLQRRVGEGRRRVTRQREIVNRLASEGRETRIAERTLKNFEDLQALLVQLANFVAHRKRLPEGRIS